MRYAPFIFLALFLVAASSAQRRTMDDGVIPSVWATNALHHELLYGAETSATGGFEEDTTSAWRYYPLHVGDAWEHKEFFVNTHYRREIVGDTLIKGRIYADFRHFIAEDGGPMVPRSFAPKEFVRFDTLSAFVYGWTEATGEYNVFEAPCSLSADFGTVITCLGGSTDVTGRYDGVLVFGGEEPGTGEDTVYTAVKQYIVGDAFVFRYGADYGHAYFESDGDFYGLYYSRVDGVEHGVPQYPTVNTEPSIPGVVSHIEPRVWPNPFNDLATVSYQLDEPGAVELAVFDVLGRAVTRVNGSPKPAGEHVETIELGHLPTGRYLIRLTMPGAVSTRMLTKVGASY